MALNKKKANAESLSEIAIRYNIRVSKPFGYFPEDVDKIIENNEKLINNLEEESQRLEKALDETKKELKAANTELQRMKLDMSLMDVPDTSTETDMAMLGRLNSINEDVGTLEQELPEEKSEPSIPIDIIENSSSDDLIFDDLISNSEKKENKQIKKPSNNIEGLYNEDGKLEIL